MISAPPKASPPPIRCQFFELLAKSEKQIKILNASRNPTSPSSASSCAQVAQDSANLAPKWQQNGAKMDSKLSAKGTTWRENDGLNEPKLIKQSMKNKAVECYSLHALMRTLWKK